MPFRPAFSLADDRFRLHRQRNQFLPLVVRHRQEGHKAATLTVRLAATVCPSRYFPVRREKTIPVLLLFRQADAEDF